MPIPAKPLSKRLKERSATLNYPSTTAPDLHNRTTRSTSVSNFAESPAFAFLKQWKEATTGTLGTVGSEGECDEGEQVGDYVLGPVIGYGGFSEIKEAHTIDPETGKKVIRAVKLLRKNNPLSSRERLAIVQSEFEHEVAIWKQLDHPNILKLLYVEEDEKATYCITERITGGTLFEFCRSMITKPQRKDVVLKYARQLGSAILYLHDSKGIVHRDIKLENCLLESKGSGEFDLLLCDFGMSEYFTRDTEGDFEVISHNDSDYIDSSSASTPRPGLIQVIGPAETSAIFSQYYLGPRPHASQRNSVAGSGGQSLSRRSSMSSTTADPADSPGPSDHFGSMPYASPELLRSDVPIIQPYVDIWSFGCTLHALLLARLPWQHSFPPKLKSLILAHEWNREGLRRRWDENAVDLLDGCFDDNPETRLTISEIMHHPFFEDTNNQVTGDRMQP
jgi:serine/threonine protein kinase